MIVASSWPTKLTHSHKLQRVGGGADEVSTGLQTLACVTHHHVRLLIALKAVVKGELAADEVKLCGSTQVHVLETLLWGSTMGQIPQLRM